MDKSWGGGGGCEGRDWGAVQCSETNTRCASSQNSALCHCFKHFEATLSQSAERDSNVMNRCKTQQDEVF